MELIEMLERATAHQVANAQDSAEAQFRAAVRGALDAANVAGDALEAPLAALYAEAVPLVREKARQRVSAQIIGRLVGGA